MNDFETFWEMAARLRWYRRTDLDWAEASRHWEQERAQKLVDRESLAEVVPFPAPAPAAADPLELYLEIDLSDLSGDGESGVWPVVRLEFEDPVPEARPSAAATWNGWLASVRAESLTPAERWWNAWVAMV